MTNYYNSLSFRKSSKLRNEIRNLASPRPNFISYFKKSLWIHAFLLVTLLTMNQSVWAQSSANYTFATNATGSLALDMNSNAIDMSSGTTQLVGSGLDAAASPVTNIGFDFYLMGSKFTQFSVQEDGILQLGGTVVGTNVYTITGGTIAAPRLSALNADFRTGTTTGKIHYKVVGSAPNRVLVVEFTNMQLFYTSTGTAGTSTWQMRLYESGNVEYVYGTISASDVTTTAANRAPSIGFYTGSATGSFASVLYAGHTVSTVAPYAANPIITATGAVAALNSAANGSRRVYSFTPIMSTSPSNPTTMTFTGITAIGTTVNWIDSSTSETYFIVTRANDAGFTTGVVTSVVPSTTFAGTGNVYSSTQTGLAPSTLYYYKVVASNESSPSLLGLTGSSSTTAPGNITSLASGNWSDTATWSSGAVPTVADNVTIAAGHVVTEDVTAAFANSLSISGELVYTATTARTLTVTGDVTINSGGALNAPASGTVTTHSLALGGNLTNNGILDFSIGTAGAGISFTGSNDQLVSGSGTTTDLYSVAMNKTARTNVVEFNLTNFSVRGLSTLATGALLTTNVGTGTIKFSGINTFDGVLWSAAGYTIPSTLGFWLNNPNFTVNGQAGSLTVAGLFRMTTGTYNVGTATGNSAGFNSASVVIIEGGTVNTASRFGVGTAGNTFTYTQTGGTVNVNSIGNASTTLASFDLGTSTTSVITFTGGTVNVVLPGSGGSGPRDVRGTSVLSPSFTGSGTINFGTAASGTSKTFFLAGNVPNFVISTASATHSVSLSAAASSFGNVLIPVGSTFNLNGFRFIARGNTFTNNGTLTGTVTGSDLYFLASAPQTYTGSGVVTAGLTSLSADTTTFGFTIDNASTGINTLRVNLFSGVVTNSSKITIGTGAALGTAVQVGFTGNLTPGGNFDVSPVWNLGTGVFNLIYAEESTSRTSGFEVQPLRSINAMTVSNPNGVVLAGGNVEVTGTLTLTSGIVTTSATNGLTLGSATAAGTLSGGSATSYINGPFNRTFATRTATGTYSVATLFPVGKSGSYLPIHIDPTTTGVVVMSGEAFKTNSGTLGGGVVTLSPNRWEALVKSGNANFTSSFIRISDAATVATNKILQAPTAAGAYASIVPGTTFATGTPNTITTAAQILATDYKGYFAYGDLNICPAPVDQATVFATSNLGATSFNGSFTVAASSPSNYLVVRYPSGSTVTNPVNYTAYTVGGALGTGTVVAVLTAPSTTFTQTGLTAGTTYDYYIYSYNNVSCYGPSYNVTTPLTSSVTTCATATVVPTALATSSLASTGFTLTWTAAATDALQLDIATNSTFTSFVTGYNAKPLVAGTTSEVVSGLTSNTVYYVRLRAINGVCYSVNSATLIVTTACDPVTAFSENFDSVTVPAFPSCWAKVGTLGTANTQSGSSSTTPNCLYLYSSTTTSRPVVKMPPVSNAGLGTHRLRFKLRGNFSSGETIEVGYLTNPDDATTFVSLQSFTASTTTYIEKTVEPGTAPGSNQVLAFRTGIALLSVLIDDVVWEAIPTDAVDYGNLQAFVVNATAVTAMQTCQTVDVYAQAYEPGATEAAGQATGLIASIGYSSTNTDPATWPESAWTAATFNVNVGNNDEFKASYVTLPAGTQYFASRFQLNGGPYRYGASNNGFWNATTNPNAVLTVNVPGAITATATSPAICSGGNTNITATSANANYTYSWSNGAGNGATVNVAPTATTTYTVTGTDSVTGCTSTATVTVTVNAVPSALAISPAAPTICAGSIQQLSATGGTVVSSNTIGSATTLTGAAAQPTAFCNRFDHYWSQMVFTVAELNAAGVQAGNINGIKFNITTLGDGTNVTDFKVYMGPTASATLTGFTTTGLNEVFSAATYSHAVGVNSIVFSTPYAWDGTSNIIVDIRQTGLDSINNAQTYFTATTGNTVVYAVTSTVSPGGSNGFVATNPAATTSTSRLNTTFDWSANTNITWSPATDLYTNATATIPYVSGASASTVYAKPITTATYTATATLGACSSNANATITVTPNTVPNFAEIGSICQGSVAPTLATTSPNGVVGTWVPATVSNTANGSYVFTPNTGQCAVTQTLNVTVNTTAAPTGDATQYGTTLADLVVSPTTGITWYASEADALASTNELPLTTALVDGATYYATQTTTCESVPFAVTIDFDLKTPSFNMNSLKYYPNPVSNVLTVTYSEAITGLKLYNMVGQQLMSKSVNSNETQLDMSHLPAGSYLLEITAGTKSKMVKLLKNQ